MSFADRSAMQRSPMFNTAHWARRSGGFTLRIRPSTTCARSRTAERCACRTAIPVRYSYGHAAGSLTSRPHASIATCVRQCGALPLGSIVRRAALPTFRAQSPMRAQPQTQHAMADAAPAIAGAAWARSRYLHSGQQPPFDATVVAVAIAVVPKIATSAANTENSLAFMVSSSFDNVPGAFRSHDYGTGSRALEGQAP